MVRFAVELRDLALEVRADVPHDLFQAVQVYAVNTRCRHFVTKTKCVCNTKKQCPASAYVPVKGHKIEYTGGIQLRYRYRLYPAAGQRSALARAFGCARVVFNDGLRARQDAHQAGLPYLTDAALSARLTAVKGNPERAWLTGVSAVVLQQSLADLNTAYRRFFGYREALREWKTGGRKGRKPREVGLPRFKSRKQDGSANRDKARRKAARAHTRVADARREFHHQISTALIRDNQAVAVEDLAVNGLARTRLAKSVHDAGWAAFTAMLEYKARLYGREFHRIGRFEPTSQACSACGVKDGPKPLHVRDWQCPACGVWLDRDVNAAVNVAKAAGLAVTACGAKVRPGPNVPAQRSETGTHPKPRRKTA